MRKIYPLVFIVAFGAFFALQAVATPPPFAVAPLGLKSLMPHPVYWAASVEYGGKLYLFGGVDNYADRAYTQIYDPVTDTWTLGTDMPLARRLASAAVANGKIYVMGGRDNVGPLNHNYEYDPVNDTWALRYVLPAALRGHSAVGIGTKVYVFGGYSATSAVKTLWIYESLSDSWSAGQVIPYSGTGSAWGNAVWVPSVDRIVYVAGQNATTGASSYIGLSFAYHPASDTWDAAQPAMPTGVSQFAIAHDPVSGKVFTFGGQFWSTAESADMTGTYNMVLDTASWTWNSSSYLAVMPSPPARRGQGALYSGGRIYLAGGFMDSDTLALTSAYDPMADTWYQPNPQSAELRQGPSVQAVGNLIYTIGGAIGLTTPGTVLAFNPATGVWGAKAAVDPVPRQNAVSAMWGGKIVLSGGDNVTSPVGGSTVLYNPAADSFSTLDPDPVSRTQSCGAVVSDTLYVFGGYDSTPTLLASTRALDLTTGNWSTKADLPVPLAEATAQAYGGKIYIIGGYDGVGGTGENELHDDVIIYDPALDSFSVGAAMPHAIRRGSSVVWGGYIVQDSGLYQYWNTESAFVFQDMSQWVQFYDPAANMWYESLPRGWGRQVHGSAIVGDRLYSIMGADYRYFAARLDIVALGGGLPCTQQPTGLTAPGASDPEPCLGGSLNITWPSEPADWNDGGVSPRRSYRVWRDGAPMTTGGCSGLFALGSTGCADNTTVAGNTYSYQVEYINSYYCWDLSPATVASDRKFEVPVIYGPGSNTCPDPTFMLSTMPYSTYQWYRNGLAIPGATDQGYEVSVVGSYAVYATDSFGCGGASADWAAMLWFCPKTEVSPVGAPVPLQIQQNSESYTGYYIYFQRVDGLGYNLYEGNIGNWYDHGSTATCNLWSQEIDSGLMRAALPHTEGNKYYLITAYDSLYEGPSGYKTNGTEIDTDQSTCGP